MNNADTQKIRLDLKKDLQQAQQDYDEKPTMEKLSLIRWLTRKLNFIGSPEYYKRKAQP